MNRDASLSPHLLPGRVQSLTAAIYMVFSQRRRAP